MKNSYFQRHTALVWPQRIVSSSWQKERNPTDDMKWHESAHHRPNTLPQSVITIMREKKRGYERKEKTVLVNLFPRWHDHCRAATAFEQAAAEKREHITTSHQCSSAPQLKKRRKEREKLGSALATAITINRLLPVCGYFFGFKVQDGTSGHCWPIWCWSPQSVCSEHTKEQTTEHYFLRSLHFLKGSEGRQTQSTESGQLPPSQPHKCMTATADR